MATQLSAEEDGETAKEFLEILARNPRPAALTTINRFLGEYLAHCLSHGVAAEAPVLAS